MNTEWLPVLELLITLFAGLGLLLAGIRLLTENLRKLADQRLRSLVMRATRSERSAALLGLTGGAVAQSIHAVILVLISLVSAGVLDARRAQPIINYANLGTALLVLLAAVNFRLAALGIIGIAGILFYLHRDYSERLGHSLRALLGAGLLFLGVVFLKESGKSLVELAWITEFISVHSGQSLLLAFAAGLIFAIIAHTATSITIVIMALAASGAIDLHYALMVIYGAGLGTGLGTLFFALDHRGLGWQLAVYQFLLKLGGLVLLLPLFWLEFYAQVPLLAAGLELLPVGISWQIAFSYILYQIACDVVMHVAHHPVQHFLDRHTPPNKVEALGRPHFLRPGAERDPATAVLLTHREQNRLLDLLPGYLEGLRVEPNPAAADEVTLHRAGVQVAQACEAFIDGILTTNAGEESLDHALILKGRNQLITGLQETLHELHHTISKSGIHQASATDGVVNSLIEALHMMLLTLNDAARHEDPDDIALLRSLTFDRAELMDQIRRRMLNTEIGDPSTREAIFHSTSLFERAVWLLHRYDLLLQPRRDGHDPEASNSE